MPKGSIAFLDVIGWKGIWAKDQDAIVKLKDILEKIREYINELTLKTTDKSRALEPKIISISDTIVISISGNPDNTMAMLVKICARAFKLSIQHRLYIRGAISYGEYEINDNILVGPAVDDSASWHELAEIFGIFLTPLAKYNISTEIPELYLYNIPLKTGILTSYLLKINVIEESNDKEELKKYFMKIYSELSYILPEHFNKYENTLKSIEAMN